MKKTFARHYILLISSIIFFSSCSNEPAEKTAVSNTNSKAAPLSFSEARKGFVTKLIKQEGLKGEVKPPPAALFSIVKYPTPIGNMSAYLSNIPTDGKLHPAIVWVTGGFGNDIGDMWTPQDSTNDQSASALWKAGIVVMYPSQRGGNTNAGSDETSFGEVDDIIAATNFLAKQKGIDPERIYLGGHSTGGTKVLLAAELNNQFRAVFSLGPVTNVKYYGSEYLTFDTLNPKEFELREPVRWLPSIKSPVYIVEGDTDPSNIDMLHYLQIQAKADENDYIHFWEVKGKNHFSAIQPVCKIIAQNILADSSNGNFTMKWPNDAGNK